MRINELFDELKKINLAEAEAFDRGQGLDPLLQEFVYEVNGLPEEDRITRIRQISDYYNVVYNRSHRNVPVAYNQTRKWAMRIYVQHWVDKTVDHIRAPKPSAQGDLFKNESINESVSPEEKHFEERTKKHISLVQKAAKKIADAYPEFADLPSEAADHDASKLEEPERTPYVAITWRHKLENEKDGYDPINGKGYQTPGDLSKDDENKATLHHVTTNSHHPEYWLENKDEANIDPKDRSKSLKCVDASKMDDISVAEMCADWQAMSEELGKNTAREWFEKQRDVRWHFSEHQVELIDRLLKVFEGEELEESHSHSKCMECGKVPTKEVLWAEGRGHAWFCDACYKTWSTTGDGKGDVCSVKDIKDGKAAKKFADNKSPNLLKESKLVESAIDFPKQGLQPEIWGKKDGKYFLNSVYKDRVLAYIEEYPGIDLIEAALEIHVCGSLATNLYTQYSDFDVHVVLDQEQVSDLEAQEKLVKEVRDWNAENPLDIAGYPCQLYIQLNRSQDYVGDSAWDLLEEFWAKGPTIRKLSFNPYTYYREILDEVSKKAQECDIEFGKISRDVIDYTSVKNAYSKLPTAAKASLRKLMKDRLKSIEEDIETLSDYKKAWANKRRSVSQPKSIEQAVTDKKMQKEWEKANAVFKFLAKYNYLPTISALESILEEDDVLDSEDVSDISKVLDVHNDLDKVSPDLTNEEK